MFLCITGTNLEELGSELDAIFIATHCSSRPIAQLSRTCAFTAVVPTSNPSAGEWYLRWKGSEILVLSWGFPISRMPFHIQTASACTLMPFHLLFIHFLNIHG